MPEGPSISIVKENLHPFIGARVLSASGASNLDFDRISNQKIIDFRTWGKHFLILFKGFAIRIHFLMFGTYKIDERKQLQPKLGLQLERNHELNFYTCAVKWIEGDVDNVYDWSADIMNDSWSATKARKKMFAENSAMVCDVLLDQNIFSGAGIIIKNEVLFRTRIHPEAKIKNLTPKKINELTRETRIYSFEFLKWRKEDTFKRHWQIYSKKTCPRCNIPLVVKPTGTSKRKSFFCAHSVKTL